MVSGSPYFDVDASSGLVFVVSAVELEEEKATVEVKVTDPKGLHATARVEVSVEERWRTFKQQPKSRQVKINLFFYIHICQIF